MLRNVSIDTTFVPLLTDTKGILDLKLVGKIQGMKTPTFFVRLVYMGKFIR